MTLVDFIDLSDDECYFKDVIDLSSGEGSVQKDGNAEEDDDNVSQSENLAEAATSLPISEPDGTAATPLSMLDNCSTMFSLMADKSMQTENREFLAISDGTKDATQPGNHELIADCVGEAMQSEREAGIFSSMTEQASATSLLLTEQGAITSSVREDKSMQSRNQVFVAAADCAEEAIQSENTAKAAGSLSMTDRGAIYNLHAQGELAGDTEKDENCDFEAETETLSDKEKDENMLRKDKEKETSWFGKFYDRKEKKQVDTGYLCHRMQQRLHNGDSGFSVMGNVRNGTAIIESNVLGGEAVMSTYQGCSKTTQGNRTDGKVRDCGSVSEGCVFQGCTNGAHEGTSLCILHVSRLHKRCCVVTGCTKIACGSSQGRADRCKKHVGGKRCKYDGCGKGVQGNTDFCIAHGGGRRCKFQGCRKSAQGQYDYCIRHGGGGRCKFIGCSSSATCGTDFCSMHRTSLLSGNNSDHEMLPEPAPAYQAKKASPSKRRNSHSVIGGRSQKRQNTNDCVNTIVETGVEKGRAFVCQNNMLEAQQTTSRVNSESGLAAGSPSLQLASTSPTTVFKF